ncbi:hypothetical protein KM043_016807 [Ampulex compressa]|nr:hypothetical protein KM043_016807 [Ampulex compressa]
MPGLLNATPWGKKGNRKERWTSKLENQPQDLSQVPIGEPSRPPYPCLLHPPSRILPWARPGSSFATRTCRIWSISGHHPAIRPGATALPSMGTKRIAV